MAIFFNNYQSLLNYCNNVYHRTLPCSSKASRISSTEDYIHSRILVGKFKEKETSLEKILIYTMMALLRNMEGKVIFSRRTFN